MMNDLFICLGSSKEAKNVNAEAIGLTEMAVLISI